MHLNEFLILNKKIVKKEETIFLIIIKNQNLKALFRIQFFLFDETFRYSIFHKNIN